MKSLGSPGVSSPQPSNFLQPCIWAASGVLLLCLLLPVSARGGENAPWSGNVNIFLGMKFLEKEDWDPVDRHTEAGLVIDVKPPRFPFSIAVDFLHSSDEENVDVEVLGGGTINVEVEGETFELDLGIRKAWEAPLALRPFLGGGLALLRARIEAEGSEYSSSDEDTAVGVWLNTGAYVTLNGRWNLGLDGRWSWAKADLMGVENADVGGWHIGCLIGAHF